LLKAHACAAFTIASDMLTRTSRTSDIAPDVSVYPRARHPETGKRQLEHLAFEIVSTESLGHAGRKAASLVARGVRRVFAIDVERGRVLEWSASLHSWSLLRDDTCIEDPALDAALPISALLRTATADDAMSSALLAKRNPVLEARSARDRAEAERKGRIEGELKGRIEGERKGRIEGELESLIRLLTIRGFSLDDATRARISSERDPRRISRWFARAVSCTTVAGMFDET
jgi:hypothetical protein